MLDRFVFTLARYAARLGGLPPALKMAQKPCEGHGVEYAIRRHTALAGHLHTPVHVVEFPGGVRIRVDAEDAAIA